MDRHPVAGGSKGAGEVQIRLAGSPSEAPRTAIPHSSTQYSVLSWYVAGVIAAVAIGYFAARLNLWGFAPVGLLSIAVGCLLGFLLAGLANYKHITYRTRIILGTLVLAAVTVLAEHAWLYRDFRRQWHEVRANSAEVALFRPETPWSPVEYFAREASDGQVALWLVDAALIAAAAVLSFLIVQRRTTKTRVASDAAKSDDPTPET